MSMRCIKKGSTDQSVVIRIIDSTDGTPEESVEHNTSGIALWYRREGATVTAITEAALASADAAHSDGGIEHLDDGYYRLDLPDAAFATGANGVMVGGTVTGMIVIGCYVHLTDYDAQDAVRMGMTALPNAAADAAGGLPISDAGGLDLDAKIGALTFTVAGDVDVNIQSIAGAALNTSSAQIGVNVVNAAGTAWGSGAITAAAIADNAIDAGAIADGAIDSGTFAAGAITAAAIANAAIDFATFAADCITGTGLKANVESISANAITATAIATGAIDADAIADNAIDAGAIAANAITDAKINTGAITAAKFAAGAIDAAAIANNAIDAATFAADVDAEIATMIWNAAAASYGGAGTYGQAVEDILADTNELQTNQGNWATATGFSTHSAADVWAATNATLSLTYAVITSRLYRFLMNKMNITDATGAVALRNEADGADLATQTITDNDTTTTRTALTWA